MIKIELHKTNVTDNATEGYVNCDINGDYIALFSEIRTLCEMIDKDEMLHGIWDHVQSYRIHHGKNRL